MLILTEVQSYERICGTLETIAKRKGLSLDMVVYDLDKKFHLEINKGHLSRWENGKNDPSVRFVSYLTQYYGVSVDYLIGLTDNRTPADLLAHRRKSN